MGFLVEMILGSRENTHVQFPSGLKPKLYAVAACAEASGRGGGARQYANTDRNIF